MAAKLDGSFTQLLSAANIGENVPQLEEWLIKKKLLLPEDFGLMATTEEDVPDNIIKVVTADVPLNDPIAKVSVTKLWMLCRNAMKSGIGSTPASGSAGSVDAALPRETHLERAARV